MCLLATLACATTLAPHPIVMVLGTYHFANPGLDAVKVRQRDTLSRDRQVEIAALIDRLATFKPTKILVEVTPERQSELDAQYRAYLNGTASLSASETQQIGFRLAKKFGHERLVGVDYKSDMDFDRAVGFAAANGMPEVPRKLGETIQKVGQAMNEIDAKYTVSQILAIHNAPEFIRFSQSFYTDLLTIAKPPEYPGADLLAGWYRRNLVIYQNIRHALVPGDRALVIYGSGHAYYLTQLLRDGEGVTLASASKLLPKPPIKTMPGF